MKEGWKVFYRNLAYFSLSILPIVLLVLYSKFQNYSFLLVVALGLSFIIFLYLLKKEVAIKDKYSVFQQLLTGNISSIAFGLIGFVIELVLIGNISNIIYTLITNKWGVADIVRLSVMIIEMFVFWFLVLIYYDYHIEVLEKEHASSEREPRKVLVLALSMPSSTIENGIPKNYKPYEKLLSFHKDKLEHIYALCSKEVADGKEKFKNMVSEICQKKVDINFIEADYNDWSNLKKVLIDIDKKLKEDNIKDEDISIYVSSGTSAVTVYLTLFGLENARQLEYTKQQDNDNRILKIVILKHDILRFINKIY